METLQNDLGYVFQNPASLTLALTHKSCGKSNNERLEFLGDSILNFVAADLIFEKFPSLPEGEMSRLRSGLVREETLAKIAERLKIHANLRYIEQGQRSPSRNSSLADALEAIFGAIYKEAGYEAARTVIRKHLMVVLQNGEATVKRDSKTKLQEYLQGFGRPLPKYDVVRTHESGSEDRRFEVSCNIEAMKIRTLGFGRTRKAAEFEAAEKALVTIHNRF